MANRRLQDKLDARKAILSQINSTILAYDPVLRERARDILLAEAFGVMFGATQLGHLSAGSPLLPDSNKSASLQDLFGRWPVKTESDRALLSAYHLQTSLGYPSTTAKQIQNNLKRLGMGLTNVTVATYVNTNTVPARMKKIPAGDRKRNQYAVTDEGVMFVEKRINGLEG